MIWRTAGRGIVSGGKSLKAPPGEMLFDVRAVAPKFLSGKKLKAIPDKRFRAYDKRRKTSMR